LQDDIVDQTIERNRNLLEELEQQKMKRQEEMISTLQKELEHERQEKQKMSNTYALELKELEDDHYRQVKYLNQTLEDMRNETHKEKLRHERQVDEISSRKYREVMAEKVDLLREIELKEKELRANRTHLESLDKLIDSKQRKLDNLAIELQDRGGRLDAKQAIINEQERQIELEFQTLHEQKQEVRLKQNEFDLKYHIYKINKDFIYKLCELKVQSTTIEIEIMKNRQEYTKHDGHLYELTILEVEKSVFQKLKAMLNAELHQQSSEDTSISHVEKQLAFYEDLYQSMEEKKITKMKKIQEIDSALASSSDEDTSRQLCKQKHRHLNDLQQVHKIFKDFHTLVRLLKTHIIWNQSGRPTDVLTHINREFDVIFEKSNF
jgi:DNA repair exonuclease SbcCD ATPase subunit